MVKSYSYPSMQVRADGDYEPPSTPAFQMIDWMSIDTEVSGDGQGTYLRIFHVEIYTEIIKFIS